jgi:hypothetical protein
MNTGGFWVQSLSATAGAANRAEDVEIFRCITNNFAVVQGRIVPRTSSPSVVIVTRDCTRRGSVGRVASFSRHSTEAVAKHAKFRVVIRKRAFPALVHVPGSHTCNGLGLFFPAGPQSIWSDTRPEYGYWGVYVDCGETWLFRMGTATAASFRSFPYSQRIRHAPEQYSLVLWRYYDHWISNRRSLHDGPPRSKKGSRHSAQHCLCDIALPDHLSRVQIEPILQGATR